MFDTTVICADEPAMRALGKQLAGVLGKGTLVNLAGELGVGKSVLARAIIHAAGYQGRVKSPTYTLLEIYVVEHPQTALERIAHLDLYRLADPDELNYLGFDDVLDECDLVMIEWPERAADLLPEASVQISIQYANDDARLVSIASAVSLNL